MKNEKLKPMITEERLREILWYVHTNVYNIKGAYGHVLLGAQDSTILEFLMEIAEASRTSVSCRRVCVNLVTETVVSMSEEIFNYK